LKFNLKFNFNFTVELARSFFAGVSRRGERDAPTPRGQAPKRPLKEVQSTLLIYKSPKARACILQTYKALLKHGRVSAITGAAIGVLAQCAETISG
jgi:hypothetical protein